MQSKRCDLHHTRLNRETNEKFGFFWYSSRWIPTTFSTNRFFPFLLLNQAVFSFLEPETCSFESKLDFTWSCYHYLWHRKDVSVSLSLNLRCFQFYLTEDFSFYAAKLSLLDLSHRKGFPFVCSWIELFLR